MYVMQSTTWYLLIKRIAMIVTGNYVKHRWAPSPSSRTGDFGVLGSDLDSMDALPRNTAPLEDV